jgi:hypothetical protein
MSHPPLSAGRDVTNGLLAPEIRNKFGFLYEAYIPRYWFFEFMDMANKVFLTSLLVFFSTVSSISYITYHIHSSRCVFARPNNTNNNNTNNGERMNE